MSAHYNSMGSATAKHTPTPWSIDESDMCILGANNQIVAYSANGPWGEDRALIVRAVNIYKTNQAIIQELTGALSRLISSYLLHCPEADKKSNAIRLARDALSTVIKYAYEEQALALADGKEYL